MIFEDHKSEKKHAYQVGECQDTDDQSGGRPVFETGMCQIRCNESRACIIRKSQQIMSFPSADFLTVIEIRRKFGTHRIAAKKPHEKCIGTTGRKSQSCFPYFFFRGEQFFDSFCMKKDSCEYHKGKKCGKKCVQP